VVRDSGVYIVGDVLRIALAWIMLPLYATYLQAAEYGIVAAAATVGAIFVVVSQLALSAVVVRCCFDHEGVQELIEDELRFRGVIGSEHASTA